MDPGSRLSVNFSDYCWHRWHQKTFSDAPIRKLIDELKCVTVSDLKINCKKMSFKKRHGHFVNANGRDARYMVW